MPLNMTTIMVDKADLATLQEAVDVLYDAVVRTGDDTVDEVAYDLKKLTSRVKVALGA